MRLLLWRVLLSFRSAETNCKLMKKTAILALTLLSASLLAEPPAKIDVSNLPKQSRVMEDVIVPVPSEVFGVLDKIGKPVWPAVLRPIKGVAKPFGELPQQALYLGTIIAEGFIAVEAQDATEVKNIGRSVISLGTALGVGKVVTKRANAIITAADASEWQTVRKELDGALSDVKEAMVKLDSRDLANLISLGGWLRGTEALCAVVEKNYSRDGADLLHQPSLIQHFGAMLGGLKSRNGKHPLVAKLATGLKNISPLVGLSDGAEISAKSVKEVSEIASGLVKAIQTK